MRINWLIIFDCTIIGPSEAAYGHVEVNIVAKYGQTLRAWKWAHVGIVENECVCVYQSVINAGKSHAEEKQAERKTEATHVRKFFFLHFIKGNLFLFHFCFEDRTVYAFERLRCRGDDHIFRFLVGNDLLFSWKDVDCDAHTHNFTRIRERNEIADQNLSTEK